MIMDMRQWDSRAIRFEPCTDSPQSDWDRFCIEAFARDIDSVPLCERKCYELFGLLYPDRESMSIPTILTSIASQYAGTGFSLLTDFWQCESGSSATQIFTRPVLDSANIISRLEVSFYHDFLTVLRAGEVNLQTVQSHNYPSKFASPIDFQAYSVSINSIDVTLIFAVRFIEPVTFYDAVDIALPMWDSRSFPTDYAKQVGFFLFENSEGQNFFVIAQPEAAVQMRGWEIPEFGVVTDGYLLGPIL